MSQLELESKSQTHIVLSSNGHSSLCPSDFLFQIFETDVAGVLVPKAQQSGVWPGWSVGTTALVSSLLTFSEMIFKKFVWLLIWYLASYINYLCYICLDNFNLWSVVSLIIRKESYLKYSIGNSQIYFLQVQ